jgi:hypothetical protein
MEQKTNYREQQKPNSYDHDQTFCDSFNADDGVGVEVTDKHEDNNKNMRVIGERDLLLYSNYGVRIVVVQILCSLWSLDSFEGDYDAVCCEHPNGA